MSFAPAARVAENDFADLADLAALRRDLHAHPELGFEEDRTVRQERRNGMASLRMEPPWLRRLRIGSQPR